MTQEQEKLVKEKIVDYIFGVSKKEILETYDEVDELYESGALTSQRFYEILDELKSKCLQ